MNRQYRKAILAKLDGAQLDRFGELSGAIFHATKAAHIDGILEELQDPELVAFMGSEVIGILAHDARVAAGDFRNDAR